MFHGKRVLEKKLFWIVDEESGFDFITGSDLPIDDPKYRDPFAHGPLAIAHKSGIRGHPKSKSARQCKEALARIEIKKIFFLKDPEHWTPAFIEQASTLSPIKYRVCLKDQCFTSIPWQLTAQEDSRRQLGFGTEFLDLNPVISERWFLLP